MDDVISRHGVSAWLNNMGYPNLAKIVMDKWRFPSVQPEPKRGKWIEYEQEFMLEGYLETAQKTVRECSVCTAKIAGMVGIMNYCPNCGADMRGEQDG